MFNQDLCTLYANSHWIFLSASMVNSIFVWKRHCTIFLWVLQAGWFGCDLYMNGTTWPQLLNCCGKVISSTGRFYNVSQQWFSLEGREIKQYRWRIWHMLALTFSHKRFNYLKWRHSLLLHNPGTYLFSEQLQFVILPRPLVSTCGSRPPSGSHIRYLCHGL